MKYSTVLAKANELGGITQTSDWISIKLLSSKFFGSTVTEYYLVPELGYLILEVIDKKESSTEKLKLQKILSLG